MLNQAKRYSRTIQPDILFDEDLFNAEQKSGLPLRIVFLGLHTMADREGRFEWGRRLFRFLMLDEPNIVEASLKALYDTGHLVCYRDQENNRYGQISRFADTQHINNRETASRIPSPGRKGMQYIEPDGNLTQAPVTITPEKVVPEPAVTEVAAPVVALEEVKEESQVVESVIPELEVVDAQAPLAANASVASHHETITEVELAVEAGSGEPEVIEASRGSELVVQQMTFRRLKIGGSIELMRIDPNELLPVLPMDNQDTSPILTVVGRVPVVGGDGVWITEAMLAYYDGLYVGADNLMRLKVAVDWLLTNESKRKTVRGLKAYFSKFLNRSQNANQFSSKPESGSLATTVAMGRRDGQVAEKSSRFGSMFPKNYQAGAAHAH